MNYQDKILEIEEKLASDMENDMLWLEKGLTLAELEKFEEAIVAYSIGLSYNPFNSKMIMSRARRYISTLRYKEAVSDFVLATKLDPNDFENWYYLGVSACLDRRYELSVEAFTRCLKIAIRNGADEIPPVVDWLWIVNMRLGRPEQATKVLEYVNEDTEVMKKAYVYKKRVMLYKGEIKPEELIDMKELNQGDPNRKNLYLVSELYALSNYYFVNGNIEKSNELLHEMKEIPTHHYAFAYLLGMQDMKERGLI